MTLLLPGEPQVSSEFKYMVLTNWIKLCARIFWFLHPAVIWVQRKAGWQFPFHMQIELTATTEVKVHLRNLFLKRTKPLISIFNKRCLQFIQDF